MLRPDLVPLIDFVGAGFSISGSLILNAIALVFIVYFGYFILVDAKYFLDQASERFGRQESGKLKMITYDIAGLISLVLASSLATPVLISIQGFGKTSANIVNIILLAVGFFITYHLASQIYTLVKQHIEKLIQETKQLRVDHQTKTKKGETG